MASEWRLLVHSTNMSSLRRWSIPLRFGENKFGRDCGFRLSSLMISREHCSIFVFCNTVTILDYSRNGTMVNDRLVHQEDEDLFNGDVIRIGNYTFMLIKDEVSETIDLRGSDTEEAEN